jgi:MbtH protein
MTNPFENESATYLVLINDEAQYSLWPSFVEVPAGWQIAVPASSREKCLDYVKLHWTDMRPRSLVEAMAADARAREEARDRDSTPDKRDLAGSARDPDLQSAVPFPESSAGMATT